MVRTFEDVALRRLSDRAIAVEVAEPLGMIGILEMRPCPVRDEPEALEILLVARNPERLSVCDYRFALRPPELHVLLVALRREVAAVAEGYYSAVATLHIPSPIP